MKSATPKKVALITGAGSGIGRAVCRRLAATGFQVVQTDSAKVPAERREKGALFVPMDVTKEASIAHAIRAAVSKFARIDCLVHCAGTYAEGSVLALDPDAYRAMLDVHLLGAVRLTRAVAPLMMKAGGGRIVHMASVAAVRGTPLAGHYAAAKAALLSFTRTTALELAATGIRVNAVLPGFMATPMARGRRPVLDSFALKRVPLGRFGRAEEVAELVEFLCASETDYITGADIAIDGGFTAR